MRPAASVMPPLTGFVPCRNERGSNFVVGQTPAIGRICTGPSSRKRKGLRESAVESDGPQPEIRFLRCAVANGREDHAPSVARPSAHAIETWVVGEPFGITARYGSDINVGVSRNRRGKGKLRSVRREIGIGLDVGRGREAAGLSTGSRYDPKIAGVLECYRVAANGGVTKQPGSLHGPVCQQR